MALKCPECGTTAHTRTSAYESATVKRTWYQCRKLDCSCTFTSLESVEKIIVKLQRPAEPEPAANTLSAARRPASVLPVNCPAGSSHLPETVRSLPEPATAPIFFTPLFPGWPSCSRVHVYAV